MAHFLINFFLTYYIQACSFSTLEHWHNLKKNQKISPKKSELFSEIDFIKFTRAFLRKNRFRLSKIYVFDIIDSHVVHYPTPVSLTYAWSFGSLAGVSLMFQIISGVSLAMHYTPHIDMAFISIEYIMRDVNYGWLVRYWHSNGASMFFIVIYGHIARGLYYGSYMAPRQYLWLSGVVLFFLLMGAAFTGYVLPWGQMSFWGATVITSMVTVVPRAGRYIAEWLWGGYVIRNPTLNRFFVLHFLLPFIIVGVTFIHLALLHQVGSNSPIGSDTGVDDVPFYSYFVSKDLFAFSIYLLVFVFFVFYYPNYMNHPDNCVPADPYETPPGVVPEWYFLPFYCMLRSIPGKSPGILGMFFSIGVLFLLPYISNSLIRNTTFRPIFKIFFWTFVTDFGVLFYAATLNIKKKRNVLFGLLFTIYYFFFFLVLFPLAGFIETRLNIELIKENNPELFSD